MTSAETGALPFAALVRARMAEKGLGLRELCRDAGLDASFFSKVLAGKRSPPAEEEMLRRLADLLGLDPVRVVVAAGRIPRDWRALWSDPALVDAVGAVLRGGPAPRAWKVGSAPARPAQILEDELL